MNDTVNIAVVGAGKAGTGHALAFSGCPGARVVRIMSRTVESARRLARLCGAEATGTDLDEVCRDPGVDAVVVASPDRFHHGQVVAAARAGKHVLCEKPMCRDEADAVEMIRAAREAGVVLMVGLVERFNHPYSEAKRRIEAGEIGRPAMILARRCHRSSVIRGRGWVNDEETGGVLNYAGTHNIDLVCWLMGSEPARVYSESGRLVLDREQRFTDSVVMTIRFDGGGIGCLYESFGYPDAYPSSVDRSLEVLGDSGVLQVDLMSQPLTVITGRHVERADSLTWPLRGDRIGGAIRAQAEHFVACILEGGPVLTSGEAGLLSIRVASAAARAAETGQAQPL